MPEAETVPVTVAQQLRKALGDLYEAEGHTISDNPSQMCQLLRVQPLCTCGCVARRATVRAAAAKALRGSAVLGGDPQSGASVR